LAEKHFAPEIEALGKRLAECRRRLGKLAPVTTEPAAYYSGLVAQILKRGEVGISEVSEVVEWFESHPKGAETWRYGMDNMPEDYNHVLK